jgi:hypothetical protein
MFLAELSAAHSKLWQWVWLGWVWLADVLHLQSEALLDSTWVLVLMSVAQTLIHKLVLSPLFLSLSKLAPLDSVSAGADFAERDQLARLMVDPRKCGQCGVGPVDHYGCSNLRSHHGEAVQRPRDTVVGRDRSVDARRGRGAAGRGSGRAASVENASAPSRVSNSCSACGWFTENLSDWPRWPLALSPAEQLVFVTQAWAELVLKCVSVSMMYSSLPKGRPVECALHENCRWASGLVLGLVLISNYMCLMVKSQSSRHHQVVNLVLNFSLPGTARFAGIDVRITVAQLQCHHRCVPAFQRRRLRPRPKRPAHPSGPTHQCNRLQSRLWGWSPGAARSGLSSNGTSTGHGQHFGWSATTRVFAGR